MEDNRIAITVWLPQAEYRALSRIATTKGAQSHHLIEQLVHGALHAPKRRQRAKRTDWSRLPDLHAQGLTDRDIADELHVTSESVRQHRVKAGLPSNARMGRRSKGTD